MTDSDFDPNKMLDAFVDVLPVKSAPPDGMEHRRGTRYNVTWRVALAIKGHEFRDGKVTDISTHGAAILNERNFKPNTSVTLHIYIPSLTNRGAPTIIKVHGRTSYAIHDQKYQCFRVGIAFVKFEQESDCAYLESRLSSQQFRVSTSDR